jgi:spermidine/putrescine transport system permease protein
MGGRRTNASFWLAFGPAAFWLILFFAVPMAVVWTYSFGRNQGLTDIAVTGTLANYARTLEPLYLAILWKSCWLALATTVLCLVLGFPVAFAIAFAGPRAKIWLLLGVMLPFWTNLLVRTYALIAVLRDQGYVNDGLALLWRALQPVLGLGDFRPLALLYNNEAVLLGLVYVQLPFMVLPLYASLDRLDRSLLEASLDLGASQTATFRRIVVPLAMPGIVSGLVLTFIPTLGSYLTPDLLGGPDSQMIANVIERQFKRANDWPFGAALSFLLMYLTFAFVAAQGALARKKDGR